MIVLFDGVCNLCNRAVDYALRRDTKRRLKFAPQQSEAGRALMEKHGFDPEAGGSIVAVEGDRAYTESRAALEIMRRLRFPCPLFYGFIVVPPFLRDAVYRWIARNRYLWFGKRDTCRVPTEEERERFLPGR